MPDPVVSVIVPYHNEGELIHRALRSIRQQVFNGAIEILLVDDASNIPVSTIVRGSADLRILRTDHNLHAAGARNLGIREARGEFVCFLDADDEYLPVKLEAEYGFLSRHPQVALVGSCGYLRDIDGTEDELIPRHVYNRYRTRIDQSFILPGEQVRQEITRHYPCWTNGIMVRRDALLQIDGFNQSWRWAAEWDLQVRLAQQFPIAYVPAYTFRYLRRENSITSTFNPSKQLSGARMFGTWYRDVSGLGALWRKLLRERIRESYLLAAQFYLEVDQNRELARHCALASLRYGLSLWGVRASARCLLHSAAPGLAQRLNPLSPSASGHC